MINSLFDGLLNSLNQDEQEKFDKWVVEVANKISEVAIELKDEELIDTILKDKTFGDSMFMSYDDTLLKMFVADVDIEKAAYKILSIMIKNK